MITLPKALLDKYDDWLEREAVDANRHGEHRKWLRYYGHLEKPGLYVAERAELTARLQF